MNTILVESLDCPYIKRAVEGRCICFPWLLEVDYWFIMNFKDVSRQIKPLWCIAILVNSFEWHVIFSGKYGIIDFISRFAEWAFVRDSDHWHRLYLVALLNIVQNSTMKHLKLLYFGSLEQFVNLDFLFMKFHLRVSRRLVVFFSTEVHALGLRFRTLSHTFWCSLHI